MHQRCKNGVPMRPPVDLVVIGAQKCGTTSLWTVLGQQDWFVPSRTKELHHFSAQAPVPDATYRGWFPERSGPGLLRGEATPDYLSSYDAPHRMHAHNPDVRLIAILRDPVERAVAAFGHARRIGAIGRREMFADVYRDEAVRRVTRRSWTDIRWGGMYGHHLRRYLELFPLDQLHVIFFEELVTDPARGLDGLWTFLGREGTNPVTFPHENSGRDARLPRMEAGLVRIRRRFPTAMGGARQRFLRRMRPALSRPPTPFELETALRARIDADYAPDVDVLARLIGRRPPWPRFAGPHASRETAHRAGDGA